MNRLNTDSNDVCKTLDFYMTLAYFQAVNLHGRRLSCATFAHKLTRAEGSGLA